MLDGIGECPNILRIATGLQLPDRQTRIWSPARHWYWWRYFRWSGVHWPVNCQRFKVFNVPARLHILIFNRSLIPEGSDSCFGSPGRVIWEPWKWVRIDLSCSSLKEFCVLHFVTFSLRILHSSNLGNESIKGKKYHRLLVVGNILRQYWVKRCVRPTKSQDAGYKPAFFRLTLPNLGDRSMLVTP